MFKYTPQLSISHWLDEIIDEISENEDAQDQDFEEIFDDLEDIFESDMETWNLSHLHKRAYHAMMQDLYINKGYLIESLPKIQNLRDLL